MSSILGLAEATMGIDTVGFTFPVVAMDSNARIHLPGGGSVQIRRGWAMIEASLPVRLFGNNIELIPFEWFDRAVTDLLLEARFFTDPCDGALDLRNLKVLRLDCGRDFDDVDHPAALLSSLATIPQRGNIRANLHLKRGVAETLTVGARTSWSGTLYDKHAETGAVAPKGRLRFEARFRPDRLASRWAVPHGGKILVAADAHPDKLRTLTEATFEELHFGSLVTDQVPREVMRCTRLKPQERYTLLGYVAAQHVGSTTELSDNTRQKYDRLMRELGVVASRGPEGARRLDWDAGRLVTS
jgi:hypothetical protein